MIRQTSPILPAHATFGSSVISDQVYWIFFLQYRSFFVATRAAELSNSGLGITAENISRQMLACDEATEPAGLAQRQRLLQSLRGQRIHISDLHTLFQAWPQATNSQLSALRLEVNKSLNSLFPPGNRRSRLRAADPALFAAMWWPCTSLERLCTATYLSIWLFAWDDGTEMDSREFSDLATNFEEAQAFRKATLQRIRSYLEVECKAEGQESQIRQPASRRSILEHFAPVGRAMINHCVLDQRKTLMQQIEFFVQMSELEQCVQLNGSLPCVQSYQRRRMGTSAVAVCLSIHEYTLDMRLPQNVVNSPMMHSLWDETNVIISVCNDILSVKKEVAQDQVDSLIPLLFLTHNQNAQAAVDHATKFLEDSIRHFNLAADALLEQNSTDQVVRGDLARFIESCRYACTANLNWSLQSGRYKLDIKSLDGGITISI